jgi:2-phosphosulfolactate phosphatase
VTDTANVHYLPQFVDGVDLARRTVVVIDLLRASTTICHALAAGAASVVPFAEVDDVRRAAAGQSRAEVLLGGERDGVRIEGFDLGNSPSEYTPSAVFGRRIYFTTTNGARAIAHAQHAQRVVIGAIVNRRSVVEAIAGDPHVEVLCAGTNGRVTREDILAAGALVDDLLSKSPRTTNSFADSARGEWQELLTTAAALGRSPSAQLALELQQTPGGRNLRAIGQDDDLVTCAQLDSMDLVPTLDRTGPEATIRADD